MALSNDLIKEFASVIGGGKEPHNDTTCYGTVARMESSTTGYVVLDGAESETPANFTVAAHTSDRVLVMLKNRSALVIGNVTHPVIMTGTLYASDAIVVEGYLTTNALRTKYNDAINGLTFDSNGIGAYSNTSSWWLKNDGTFQFGGNNGIKFSDNKVRFGSDVVVGWGNIPDKPAIPTDIADLTDNNSKLWTTTIAENWITTQNIYSQTLQVDMAKVQGKLQAGRIEGVSGDNSENGGSYIDFTSNTMHIRNISADEITSGTLNVNYIGTIPNSKLSGTITGKAYTGATAWEINLAAGTMTLGQISADKIATGTLTVGGTNNGVGSITIKNASGGTIGSWNNTGITAEYGTIAGWKIEPTALSKEVTISETVNGSTVSAKYKPYIQALANPTASNTAIGVTRTVGSSTTWPFVVYYDGSLLATKANITGVLTAGANSKIGPWNVTADSIWYGNAVYKNSAGIYLGTSGLSLSDKFYVGSDGVPYCMGADLYLCRSSVATGNGARIRFKLGTYEYGSIGIDSVGTNDNGLYLKAQYGNIYLKNNTQCDALLTFLNAYNAHFRRTKTSWVGAFNHSAIDVYDDGTSNSGAISAVTIQSKTGRLAISSYPSNDDRLYFSYITEGNYSGNTNTASQISFDLPNRSISAASFVGALTGDVTGNVTGNCSGSSGSCTGQIKNVEGNSYYGIVTSSTDKQRIATIRCSTDTTGRIIVRGQFNSTTYSTRYFDTSPTSSDIRLKTNIEYSSVSALPIINAIKIRSFDWKEDMRHQRIGMVADELEILDPMFTVGGGCEEDGSINVKAVNSFYLQGYIVKAIQELSDENQKLKEEISKLKGAA